MYACGYIYKFLCYYIYIYIGNKLKEQSFSITNTQLLLDNINITQHTYDTRLSLMEHIHKTIDEYKQFCDIKQLSTNIYNIYTLKDIITHIQELYNKYSIYNSELDIIHTNTHKLEYTQEKCIINQDDLTVELQKLLSKYTNMQEQLKEMELKQGKLLHKFHKLPNEVIHTVEKRLTETLLLLSASTNTSNNTNTNNNYQEDGLYTNSVNNNNNNNNKNMNAYKPNININHNAINYKLTANDVW